jgi:hypothetical protein
MQLKRKLEKPLTDVGLLGLVAPDVVEVLRGQPEAANERGHAHEERRARAPLGKDQGRERNLDREGKHLDVPEPTRKPREAEGAAAWGCSHLEEGATTEHQSPSRIVKVGVEGGRSMAFGEHDS